MGRAVDKYTKQKASDLLHPGWIYFLRSQDFIKIGFTDNLKNRIDTHFCSNPHAELVAAIKGTRRDEGELHRKFAHLKYKRMEWFHFKADLYRMVMGLTTSNKLALSQSELDALNGWN